jgi:hypothetical protein
VAPCATLLEVRIGDSFVVDVNDFPPGLIYAVDAGARMAVAAVGSYNNSHFAQEAMAYTHSKGVVLAASAADENSFHHNDPGDCDQVVTVKAIVPDSFLPPWRVSWRR